MRYIAFSGGADSTALALYFYEKGEEFKLVFSDTGAELPETYWTIPRVARYTGAEIVVVSNGTYYQWLVNYGFLLPGIKARWCTRILKQVSQDSYFGICKEDDVVSIGIRADEPHRLDPTIPGHKKDYTWDRPLIEAGMDKKAVIALCEKHGLLNPCYKWRSNCSCFCCQFQRKNDWLGLLRNHPDLYAMAEEWERISLESERCKYAYNMGFTLEALRQADEAQLALWHDPVEQACAICSW